MVHIFRKIISWPKNPRSSVTVLGSSHFCKGSNFPGAGLLRPSRRICPQYITSCWKKGLSGLQTRFLSLSVRGFLAATECNASPKMPEWAKLPFLFYTIGKTQLPKINYPKAEKDQISPRRKKALARICQKFCVKEFHGMQIMALLEQQGFKLESD